MNFGWRWQRWTPPLLFSPVLQFLNDRHMFSSKPIFLQIPPPRFIHYKKVHKAFVGHPIKWLSWLIIPGHRMVHIFCIFKQSKVFEQVCSMLWSWTTASIERILIENINALKTLWIITFFFLSIMKLFNLRNSFDLASPLLLYYCWENLGATWVA